MVGRLDPLAPMELDAALQRWQDARIISADQADAIRRLEQAAPAGGPVTPAPLPARTTLSPSTLITYIGGFLVLVASVVFVGLGWSDMGKVQQLFWAVLAVGLPWLAAWALRKTGQPLAIYVGQALVALGTVAIVLLGYTIWRLAGWWPEHTRTQANQDRVNELMIVSQTVAAVVAVVFAFRLRAPWMILVGGMLGWIAWTTSIDLWVPRDELEDPAMWIMSLYGVVLVALGLLVARAGLRQHAFFLFLVGLAATFLFLGIDSFRDALGPTGLIFLMLSIVAIALSLWIEYRIFLVFGALGLYAWVSALVIDTFGGSRPVAFGLILLGGVIVAGGLAWQRWFQHRFDRDGHGGSHAPVHQ